MRWIPRRPSSEINHSNCPFAMGNNNKECGVTPGHYYLPLRCLWNEMSPTKMAGKQLELWSCRDAECFVGIKNGGDPASWKRAFWVWRWLQLPGRSMGEMPLGRGGVIPLQWLPMVAIQVWKSSWTPCTWRLRMEMMDSFLLTEIWCKLSFGLLFTST